MAMDCIYVQGEMKKRKGVVMEWMDVPLHTFHDTTPTPHLPHL
jgi:hypothetical protein